MIVAGCDIGAVTGKVVIMEDDRILSHSIVRVRPESELTAQEAMDEALEKAGLSFDQIDYCIGTGYARIHIPFADETVTEIACHGKGAHWIDPLIRTVIDIGGQDSKVIKIDDRGMVQDFAMNDKCAAGTGMFLEDIAGVLELKVEDLGPISLQAKEVIKISNQCSVFALSEVISLVAEERAIPDIVAGINDSVASRMISMVYRIGLEEKAILSGGVAKNAGVCQHLEEKLGVKLVDPSPVDPQVIGAIGAALFAKTALEKKDGNGERL